MGCTWRHPLRSLNILTVDDALLDQTPVPNMQYEEKRQEPAITGTAALFGILRLADPDRHSWLPQQGGPSVTPCDRLELS